MKEYIPSLKEIQTRQDTLRSVMKNRGIDLAWIIEGRDLFYFSGTAQNGHLLIPSEGESLLLIKKYFPRAESESPMKNIRQTHRLKDVIQDVSALSPKRIGIEADVLPWGMVEKFRSMLPSVEWMDISMEIRQIRMVKSEWEIRLVKRAAALLDDMFERLPEWIRPGMTELELIGLIEGHFRRSGHQGILPMRQFNGGIHYGSALFGGSATVRGQFDGPVSGPGLYPAVPGGSGLKPLEVNEPIFVDLVAGFGGYMADATRIFCIGELSEEMVEAHLRMVSLQNEVIQWISAGLTGEDVYEKAIEKITEYGYRDKFMGPPDDQVSFIAHGLGLEIDEWPLIAKRFALPIPPGANIALEPKVIFPGKGVVGIENTWWIRPDGAEKLLHFPDDIVFLSK